MFIIFLNIFRRKICRKNVCFDFKKLLFIFLNGSLHSLAFKKNVNFFAKDWQKSTKIVVITLTPDEFEKTPNI
jgi:hypothetical protein